MRASLEGFGRGLFTVPYALSERGVPVLNSFYFGFGVGGEPVDNRLQYLMVLPGGPSVDLTPEADLAASQILPGKADLAFMDHDPGSSSKDRYFFRAAHVMLNGRQARRFQFRDVGDSGSVRRRLPAQLLGHQNPVTGAAGGVLALAGFKIFFTGNRDHDIDQIAVMLEDDGTYTIAFNDSSDDDVFAYLLDVVSISGVEMNITRGEASGTDRQGVRIDIPHPRGTDLVLRGFNFDFSTGDRHLREIGIIHNNDRMDIFYGDRTPDDLFNWHVRWAHVGPRLLSQ
ncbi:MAG: hypothetical protein QOG72_3200 [Sphingomonadales bacterium]|jgi:hypothetical protein|nr:hypothetical protein [Sphingomonadales bacterium]